MQLYAWQDARSGFPQRLLEPGEERGNTVPGRLERRQAERAGSPDLHQQRHARQRGEEDRARHDTDKTPAGQASEPPEPARQQREGEREQQAAVHGDGGSGLASLRSARS